jgi:hypothetical protein
MKQCVVFVTGIGRSGSTLLDLMLGNGRTAFSAGELYALFRPFRPHHRLQDGCFCDQSECTFWWEMKAGGEATIYSNLFDKLRVRTVIDSSKHPLWLSDQLKYSVRRNYSVVPLIIYKSPLEFAYSLHKRGILGRWRSMWMRRHQWLFEILDDFIAVSYKRLAQVPVQNYRIFMQFYRN